MKSPRFRAYKILQNKNKSLQIVYKSNTSLLQNNQSKKTL